VCFPHVPWGILVVDTCVGGVPIRAMGLDGDTVCTHHDRQTSIHSHTRLIPGEVPGPLVPRTDGLFGAYCLLA
jgi:hypothetical protein